ncbi:hypothetical protein E3U23_11140 [Erythrobacter litoralis]|uniref:hypothetical protein n=1 Tax=Erythrobacter litoralis TaxID=39960 RepID=UPI002434B72F|nr:hypothetical protein [Erythrobacter litoralis]MDG6079743.1 hypothetical protein [Erythrobacter litoralis]
MSITATVQGSPQFITVSSPDALKVAYAMARGGEVIVLDTPGDPFHWRITAPKPAWVQVVMPRAQILSIELLSPLIRTQFAGGTYSADAVLGTTDNINSKSIQGAGASHVWIAGAVAGQAKNCVSFNGCSHFIISKSIFEWARADASQFVDCHYFIFEDNFSRDGVIVTKKIRFFDDGTPPQVGSDIGVGWYDSSHPDIGQPRAGCSHFIFRRNDFVWLGQGVVDYDTVAALPNHHYLIEDNDFACDSPNGIDVSGAHGTMRRNTLRRHPTATDPAKPFMRLRRFNSATIKTYDEALYPADGSGNPVQGGQNVAVGDVGVSNPPATANGVAVDLLAAAVNGDPNVELPIEPDLAPLPWGHEIQRPEYISYNGPIEIVNPSKLHVGFDGEYFTVDGQATVEVGSWVSFGLGATRGFPASPDQRAWRTLRDGEVIPGTTGVGDAFRTYRMKAGDRNITCEQSIDNGPWVRSTDSVSAVDAGTGTPPPGGATYSLEPSSLSQPEGDAGLTEYALTVSRDDASAAGSVEWYTHTEGLGEDGPPAAKFEGGAYPSGTLEFAAGEEIKTIRFSIVANADEEPEYVFYLDLRNADPGMVDTTFYRSLITIQNDDTTVVAAAFVDAFDNPSASDQQLGQRTGWMSSFANLVVSAAQDNVYSNNNVQYAVALREGSAGVSPQRVQAKFLATVRAGIALFGTNDPIDGFTGYAMRLNSGGTSNRIVRFEKNVSKLTLSGASTLVPDSSTSATCEVVASVFPTKVEFKVFQTIDGARKHQGTFVDDSAGRITAGGYGIILLSGTSGTLFDNWEDGGEISTEVLPATVDGRYFWMGQSEEAHLTAPESNYQKLPMPANVPDGNVVVYRRTGSAVGDAVQATLVTQATADAKLINPAMATLATWLDHAKPGMKIALACEHVGGTSRATVFNDDRPERSWADVKALHDAMTGKYGPVDTLIERWHNSDAGSANYYDDAFFPYWYGKQKDGTPVPLGQFVNVNGQRVDHCLFDATGQGRGLLADTATFAMLTPMPFNDLDSSNPENPNFSGPNAGNRWLEPKREIFDAIQANPIAQQYDTVTGPSSHGSCFYPVTIHPNLYLQDGIIYYLQPAFVPILRDLGDVVGEPAIDVENWDVSLDNSYAIGRILLPNNGTLITRRQERGLAMPEVPSPHQQELTGFELTRAATGERRPIYRMDAVGYPDTHKGTVTIEDAAAGTVRIALKQAFQPGDSISYLRGPATAALLRPRDYDNRLYLDMPTEHDSRYYNPAHTYPYPGHSVKPHQREIVVR